MRRSLFALAVVAVLLTALVVVGTGCKKPVAVPAPAAKVEPPAPAPPPPPAPTITLSASPSAIEKGESSTLSWRSSNATGVAIDGGIGTVEASGSRTVSPATSTTYTARATGPGGSTTAEARVTVTAPAPVTPAAAPPLSDDEFFTSNVQDIYFDYDKYNIRDDARATLQADARALAERGTIRFTIEGHCDERGSEKYNLALGDRRANSTKEFLTGQGVPSDRIETVSYGKERPFCAEHNEDCWQKNRRAHFVRR